MISTAIKKAFEKGRKRGWDRIYVAVDIHDTVVEGRYNRDVIDKEFYPNAKETLQYLSSRKDVVLIVFTCSHPEEVIKYQNFFKECGINFQYANENPGVLTSKTGLGNYDKKMYFDVLLEDKAGFEPEIDWDLTFLTFQNEPFLCIQNN